MIIRVDEPHLAIDLADVPFHAFPSERVNRLFVAASQPNFVSRRSRQNCVANTINVEPQLASDPRRHAVRNVESWVIGDNRAIRGGDPAAIQSKREKVGIGGHQATRLAEFDRELPWQP